MMLVGSSEQAGGPRVRSNARSLLLSAILACACAAGGCGSSKPTSTPPPTQPQSTAPTISTQPINVTVNVGQPATFSVVAAGTSPLTYQWQRNSANISAANSTSYTIPETAATDNAATFDVVVSNSAGTLTSNIATLTVSTTAPPPPPPAGAMVLTWHNDIARTGQNLNETALTTANVNSVTFGKIGTLTVQGNVDAEPLYVSNLTIGAAAHNVVFVVTEQDMVYAFDASSLSQLWAVSVLGSGETPSDQVNGCGQVAPVIGVTSTPVIDMNAGAHGTIFLVAMSKDGSGNYHQRLHALDLTTGAEQTGSPATIQATFPGTGANSSNGQVVFDPKQYKERASLLALNGVIYTSWASHCDDAPFTGWVIGYSETTMQQARVLNITPNGSDGAIWMSGAGLNADSSGNIYFLDANGTFDDTLDANGLPVSSDYGNAFIKVSTNGNSLAVADYFTMSNTDSESDDDVDLGSGGAVLLPDLKDAQGTTWHLAVGAGKDHNIYVVNRDMMGKFNAQNDNSLYQQINDALPGGIWAAPAYFNNAIYYGDGGGTLKAFPIANALLAATPSSQSAVTFGYPGTDPSVSANGTASPVTNGIVWAIENGGIGVLHAYDATNLANELYNSNQAPAGRDQFPTDGNVKFVTPMIANGRVFVGTPNAVVAFGLLQ